MVDRIENNVFQTQDFVEKAVEQTKKAVEYQTKSRKVIKSENSGRNGRPHRVQRRELGQLRLERRQ